MYHKIIFQARGHKNIQATHKTTLEFTKAKDVTLRGDCIVGIDADFDAKEVKKIVQGHETFQMTITCDEISEYLTAQANPDFCDEHEIVVRMGEFASSRTLGVRASKAAKHLSRELIDEIKKGKKIEVCVETIE